MVDGDAVWLYDARHERWCFCDGASLVAFAVSEGPTTDGDTTDAARAERAAGAAGAERREDAGKGDRSTAERFPPPVDRPGDRP